MESHPGAPFSPAPFLHLNCIIPCFLNTSLLSFRAEFQRVDLTQHPHVLTFAHPLLSPLARSDDSQTLTVTQIWLKPVGTLSFTHSHSRPCLLALSLWVLAWVPGQHSGPSSPGAGLPEEVTRWKALIFSTLFTALLFLETLSHGGSRAGQRFDASIPPLLEEIKGRI